MNFKIQTCKLTKILSFVLICFNISCSSLPGSSLSTGNIFISDNSIKNIVKITPELILELNKINPATQVTETYDFKNMIKDYNYKVGPGDVLNVIVWDHPELTIPAGEYRTAGESGNAVHPDGTIFYPYIGRISVNNLHVSEIRELITSKLSNYIENPQVDVSVAEYNSQKVFISGSVKNPGILPITNTPLTLLDAISISGGLNDDADSQAVTLHRADDNKISNDIIDLYSLLHNGDIKQNRLLLPGDIVNIPSNQSKKVLVMGDVNNAGIQYIHPNGLSLTEAVNNAGIDIKSSDTSGIFVLRLNGEDLNDISIYNLDASLTSTLIVGTKFQLEPLDIVYVTTAPSSRWNILVSQILPSVSALYQLDRFNNNGN